MIVEDKACRAMGFVTPSFVDLSTGRRVGFGWRCNQLSYMSAEAMAAAFGGDPSYIPSKVGFIFGTEGAVTFGGGIGRDQSWSKLKGEVSGISNADVQVVVFSCSPTVGGDGSDDESLYSVVSGKPANAVTFHAVSNSQDKGTVGENNYFQTNNFIYQAVLLSSDLHVISRVSLKDTVKDKYLQKPDGFEIALDWTIVFK